MLEVYTGKVKWFDPKKGYGFIAYEDNGESKEAFVHYSAIRQNGFKSLTENQKVSFTVENTDKGIQAKNVEIEED